MLTNGISLYHSSQIRDCERIAMTDTFVSESELMARAGCAAFNKLRLDFPSAHKIAVFCGSGNNAGDGYVLARLAHEAGLNVVLHQYKAAEHLPPAAKAAAMGALAAGIVCHPGDDAIDLDTDLIVDALLGTGLKGQIQEPILGAIHLINSSDLPVFSIDLPSGLHADTGKIFGTCVRATSTLTFIGYKAGMLTLEGPEYCGELSLDDLSLSTCLSTITPIASVLGQGLTSTLLSKRKRNCHKSDFGHVLIVGGDYGMAGAVRLAAQAALRVGAGMVSIATRPEHACFATVEIPEVMAYGIKQTSDLLPLIQRATHCVIGPGLGTDEWGQALFHQVIASQLPMIIDASALRLLAKHPQQDDNWVLTPHPGEAASLLSCSIQAVQNDRFHAVSHLQASFGGQIVLKGSGSLVCTDESSLFACAAGNPGMATAGMGDVLSGVIAGLAAQGLSLADATKLGVWLHSQAADIVAQQFGERGMMAHDLMNYLRKLVNDL